MSSYAHGITSVPLLGDTIGENLRRTVERFGEREAVVSCQQNYRTTYRQFWEETSVIGRALMARGIQKGHRVGLWSPNRFEWVVTQYATSRIGAILVNINPLTAATSWSMCSSSPAARCSSWRVGSARPTTFPCSRRWKSGCPNTSRPW